MPTYSGRHLSIHPSINELLQARLPAQMLGISIVRCHVLPRIDFQHMARRGFRVWLVRLGPGQPPVINTAFLLAADIAIKCFSPGHAFTFHLVTKTVPETA